jgi:Right handed beta helix region
MRFCEAKRITTIATTINHPTRSPKFHIFSLPDRDRQNPQFPAPMQQIKRDVLTHEGTSQPEITIAQTSTVLLVDTQGNGDYKTIAEAIAQAPDHSTIFLAAGTYRESFTIDRPLTILGDEQDRPEIAGRIVCDSDHILLQNLFLHSTHIGSYPRNITATVTQLKGELQVKNCLIQAGHHNAFNLISSQTKLTASHCIIQNSEIGIYSNDCGQVKLDNCEIKHTESGILVNRGREIILDHCQVHSSRSDGIKLEACDRATISHCKIFNNQGIGILLRNIVGFDINHTELFDHGKNGVCIYQRSHGTIEQCKFHGNSWPSLFLGGGANAEVSHSHFYEGFTEAIKLCEASHLKVTKTTIEHHNEKAIWVNPECNLILKNCSILRNTDAGLYIVQDGCAVVENTRFRGNGHGRKVGAIETYGKLIVRYCSINHNHLGIQAHGQASVILRFSNLGFNSLRGLQGTGSIGKSITYTGFNLPNLNLASLRHERLSTIVISSALVCYGLSAVMLRKAQSAVSESQSQLESLQTKLTHEQNMRSIESSRYQTDQSLAQKTLQNAYDQEKQQSAAQHQTLEKQKLALADENKTLQTEKANLHQEKIELITEKSKLNAELSTEKAEVERLKNLLALRGYPSTPR